MRLHKIDFSKRQRGKLHRPWFLLTSGALLAVILAMFPRDAAVAAAQAVMSQTPAPDATGVDPATSISITFADDVAPSSVAIEVHGPARDLRPGELSYDASTRTATLRLAEPLASGTTYTVTVYPVVDLSGNRLEGSSWSFTTARAGSASSSSAGPSSASAAAQVSGPLAAPTVMSRVPAPDATGVAPDTVVAVTFADDVVPSSVAIEVHGPARDLRPGELSYDASTRTATLRLAEPLGSGLSYTVTVYPVVDRAGHRLGSFNWTFTTAGGAASAAAAGSSSSPARASQALEPLAVTITLDRTGEPYVIGESATVCVTVNRWAQVQVTYRRNDRVVAVLFDDRMNGRTCLYQIFAPIITGPQTFVIEALEDGQVAASATAWFELVDFDQ